MAKITKFTCDCCGGDIKEKELVVQVYSTILESEATGGLAVPSKKGDFCRNCVTVRKPDKKSALEQGILSLGDGLIDLGGKASDNFRQNLGQLK